MAPGGFSRWPGGGPGMKIFENFSKNFWCPKCVQNEYLGGKKAVWRHCWCILGLNKEFVE